MDAEKARSVLTEERDRLRELGSWSREHEGAASVQQEGALGQHPGDYGSEVEETMEREGLADESERQAAATPRRHRGPAPDDRCRAVVRPGMWSETVLGDPARRVGVLVAQADLGGLELLVGVGAERLARRVEVDDLVLGDVVHRRLLRG